MTLKRKEDAKGLEEYVHYSMGSVLLDLILGQQLFVIRHSGFVSFALVSFTKEFVVWVFSCYNYQVDVILSVHLLRVVL